MKIYLLIFIGMLAFSQIGIAQESNRMTSFSIGGTSLFLDNGYGVHLGLNTSKPVSNRFSVEGQVSAMGLNLTSSFLSGTRSRALVINAMAGGRYYFSSPEKSTRVYANTLLGFVFVNERFITSVSRDGAGFGLSLGTFVEMEKILIGASVESPQNYVLRIGYIF